MKPKTIYDMLFELGVHHNPWRMKSLAIISLADAQGRGGDKEMQPYNQYIILHMLGTVFSDKMKRAELVNEALSSGKRGPEIAEYVRQGICAELYNQLRILKSV